MRRCAAIPLLFVAVLTAVLLSGCVTQPEQGKIGVVVTIPPQKEMVQAIGGDNVRITVMVPPNENPHTYSPTPTQLAEVADAKIYFKVGSGVEFEIAYLSNIQSQNKKLLTVDCSQGIELIESIEDHEHGHGEDGHGEHEAGKDPHIWLSPMNAKQMVRNICEGLAGLDEANRGYYEGNRDTYLARLDELDAEIRRRLEGKEGSPFLVYHPAWAYYARTYGLVEMAIEEQGKQPGPSGVIAVVEQARKLGIRVVFVSPQFSQSSAETIAKEIGGRVVTVDPLASNYIDNLKEVTAKLAEGLVG